jgi:cell fate regulator YaaT (PSP1 superfamily)
MTASCVVRVEFGGAGRFQYCAAGEDTLQPGDMVVVDTDWGVGMGQVSAMLPAESAERLPAPLRGVLRRATPTDLSRRTALAQREREARTFCKDRIQARNLPMKLSEVRIGLDSSKALFYFTAEGRVDFRELVKDLVQHLRTRVELRQIGVRDEAKVLACAGACGRAVCCRTFLQGFAPVSIRMAKDQNLALNPGKLSGICGRLKCCLIYEHAVYAELRKGVPKIGSLVTTSHGPGAVRAQNILDQTVQVGLETGGQVTLRAGDVTVRPRPETPPRPKEGGRSGGHGRGGQPRAGGPDRGPRSVGPPAAAPAEDGETPADLAGLEDHNGS